MIRVRAIVLAAALASGCDGGLEPPAVPPEPVPTGSMSGTVRFTHWDSAGTVLDLRLVAFRFFPPGDIVQEVLQGRAVVYPPLGWPPLATPGIDSLAYTFFLPAGTYAYVAVAQQYGPDVMNDWRAVGQYDLDSNLTVPSAVTIRPDSATQGVDISVDFTDLPPPPFP